MQMKIFAFLALIILPIVTSSAGQETSVDKYLMKLCAKSVGIFYSDPKIEPLFPSVPDAISTTCKCVNSNVLSDSQLLSSFQRLTNGDLSETESKKLDAYIHGRFLVSAFSCMAKDLDRASKGIGPRSVS